MKYAYIIKTCTDLGEGYEDMSKWYKTKNQCEYNLIKYINSKKIIEDLNNNDVYNCYINLYLVSDEHDDQINFVSIYKIIKSKESLIYSDRFYTKINISDFE